MSQVHRLTDSKGNVETPLTEGKKTRRKKAGKLESAKDVRRFLSRLIKWQLWEGGDSTEYYRLAMMASILLKAVETAELEERITKLEAREGKL